MWPGAQGLFNYHNSSRLRTSYLPNHKYTLDGLVRAVAAARMYFLLLNEIFQIPAMHWLLASHSKKAKVTNMVNKWVLDAPQQMLELTWSGEGNQAAPPISVNKHWSMTLLWYIAGNVRDQGEICLSVLIMYIQGHQAQCGSMSINFLHVHTSTSRTPWGSIPLAPFMWTQGTSSTVWKHVYELSSCVHRDIKHTV